MLNKVIEPTIRILPLQQSLRPVLPTVIGNVDYTQFEAELQRIDQILVGGGIERLFVCLSLEAFEARAKADGLEVDAKARIRHQRQSERALRCTVLKNLLGGSYREMSRRLAECPLFRRFCRLDEFEEVRVPSKSTLQDYAHWLEPGPMQSVLDALTAAAGATDPAGISPIALANALELEAVWTDSTCLKANIHFPVDWVLLRDATRTLMKAVRLIRQHGLIHRMEEPEAFLSRMNSLCMAMSAGRRKPESKKARKKVLRQMKRLLKTVEGHARRYRELLDLNWEQTDWTRPQVEGVLGRMDAVLSQLPAAVHQAHERIIGERVVASRDKILSLYESDLHVIVRGKAGAEVEFGNTLFIAEQADGFIVDHELLKESSPGDGKWLHGRVDRLCEVSEDRLLGVFADRGFANEKNEGLLEEKGLFNGLCPRDPGELRERLGEEVFAMGMKRRAQTEGRISILKNAFLGGIPRAKGFANRQLAVAWAVLAHNLWVLARLPQAGEQSGAPPLAEAA